MEKSMLTAALLVAMALVAMALVAALPALAQEEFVQEEELETGLDDGPPDLAPSRASPGTQSSWRKILLYLSPTDRLCCQGPTRANSP